MAGITVCNDPCDDEDDRRTDPRLRLSLLGLHLYSGGNLEPSPMSRRLTKRKLGSICNRFPEETVSFCNKAGEDAEWGSSNGQEAGHFKVGANGTANIPRVENPPLQLQRRPGTGQWTQRRWSVPFSRCRSTIGRCWARSGPDV